MFSKRKMDNFEIRLEGEESTTPTPATPAEGTVEGATEETAQDGGSPDSGGSN